MRIHAQVNRTRKTGTKALPAPKAWRKEVAEVLLEPERIRARVARMAALIQRDYKDAGWPGGHEFGISVHGVWD